MGIDIKAVTVDFSGLFGYEHIEVYELFEIDEQMGRPIEALIVDLSGLFWVLTYRSTNSRF